MRASGGRGGIIPRAGGRAFRAGGMVNAETPRTPRTEERREKFTEARTHRDTEVGREGRLRVLLFACSRLCASVSPCLCVKSSSSDLGVLGVSAFNRVRTARTEPRPPN